MILNFWDANLNPVTMLSKETAYMYVYEKKIRNNDTIFVNEDLSLNPIYVASKEVQENFGIGAKKLKNMLNREYFKDVKHNMYCLRASVEALDFSLPSKINASDIIDYIHSSELKEILKIDTMQLFTLAKRHRWKKYKFKGHGQNNFFLRSQVLK